MLLWGAPWGSRYVLPCPHYYCSDHCSEYLKLDVRWDCLLGIWELSFSIDISVAIFKVGSTFYFRCAFALPHFRVFAAALLLVVGTYFLVSTQDPKMDSDGGTESKSHTSNNESIFMKNVLLGITMTGLNPGFLGTYGAAIATGKYLQCYLLPCTQDFLNQFPPHEHLFPLRKVYSTGLLVFSMSRAVLFALGVSGGIYSWFSIMLMLLKRHKQVRKGENEMKDQERKENTSSCYSEGLACLITAFLHIAGAMLVVMCPNDSPLACQY